ncbi:hypothetical protein [Futiania mangrovi]|uniref:Uncharacterized protein n=1 Tax=Futiania mangrovi TaxID=2959716 RepID=A0A9J6PGC0_9PROT|nr:hypothetical protein [Futiania mangrovii]MCP1337785.1 hypothetical protein [Futiania mangrovii]
MTAPEWMKPASYGAVLGAIALAVIGFTAGGWMTAKAADEMASAKARSEVLAALVPICVVQSEQDPQMQETMANMKAARTYERDDMLMKAGWATMPGSAEPNRAVASACMDRLAKTF